MKRYICLVFAAALFGACVEPIEFDPGEMSPYAVLLSRPTNDSTVSVYISQSRFFLDNSAPQVVSDAQVTLAVNGVETVGVFDNTAYNGYGAYTFAVLPQPGDSLRVEARVPRFDARVTASTYIPQLPDVEVLEVVLDTGNGSYYDEYGGYYTNDSYYYKVRFKVKSQSNNEYFAVRLLTPSVNYGSTWDTLFQNIQYFSVNDPIVNNVDFADIIDGDDGSFYGSELFFSSELFTGGSHEFSAVFSLWPSLKTEAYVNMPIVVEVRALSKELYRYIQTTEGYYSEIDELFGEPVQVYCNIDGGIGIFGGSSLRCFVTPQARCGRFDHSDGYYYKSNLKNNRKTSR